MYKVTIHNNINLAFLNSRKTKGFELSGATLKFVENGMEALKKSLYLKF